MKNNTEPKVTLPDSNDEDIVLKSKLVNDLKKTPPLLQKKSSGSIRLIKHQEPVIKEAVNVVNLAGFNLLLTYKLSYRSFFCCVCDFMYRN